MMGMRHFSHIVAAMLLVAGGAFFGREIFSQWMGSNKTKDEVHSTSSRPLNHFTSPRGDRISSEKNLAGLKMAIREQAAQSGSLAEAMSGMDTHALRDLAESQSAALQGTTSNDEFQLHIDLQRSALAELWKREGVASLDWAIGREQKVNRLALVEGLLLEGLKDSQPDVLTWLETHRSRVREMFFSIELFSLAMAGALENGVEEVRRVHGMFPNGGRIDPFQKATFPDDLDFDGIYTGLLSRNINMNSFLKEWAFRDPDSAFAAIKRDMNSFRLYEFYHGMPQISIMMGAIAQKGERAGIEWFIEQMAPSIMADPSIGYSLPSNLGATQLSTEGVSSILSSMGSDMTMRYLHSLGRKHNGYVELTQLLQDVPHDERMEFIKFTKKMTVDDDLGPRLQAHFKISDQELESFKMPNSEDTR